MIKNQSYVLIENLQNQIENLISYETQRITDNFRFMRINFHNNLCTIIKCWWIQDFTRSMCKNYYIYALYISRFTDIYIYIDSWIHAFVMQICFSVLVYMWICVIIPELTYVVEMAEWLDTMSSAKLGGFRSHLEACMWGIEGSLCVWIYRCLWLQIYEGKHSGISINIYIYIYIYIYISIIRSS